MGDLRMGLFRQMEGSSVVTSPRLRARASRGGRFEVQEQAMIHLGVPEAVAGDGAKAFVLFAEGDARYVMTTCP